MATEERKHIARFILKPFQFYEMPPDSPNDLLKLIADLYVRACATERQESIGACGCSRAEYDLAKFFSETARVYKMLERITRLPSDELDLGRSKRQTG